MYYSVSGCILICHTYDCTKKCFNIVRSFFPKKETNLDMGLQQKRYTSFDEYDVSQHLLYNYSKDNSSNYDEEYIRNKLYQQSINQYST